jgi:transposase
VFLVLGWITLEKVLGVGAMRRWLYLAAMALRVSPARRWLYLAAMALRVGPARCCLVLSLQQAVAPFWGM